ncbi:MAG: hypothetical protein R3A10_05435 [Caldilineaceae bacterium]
MNFIFFIPDELRAESVGCYGHPLVSTPNMDAGGAGHVLTSATCSTRSARRHAVAS